MADDLSNPSGLTPDPWQGLRRSTPARIALGRAGSSLPTAAWLDFQLGHAMARDAVHQSFEIAPLQVAIEGLGHESIVVQTRAADRATYLRRPDLGRRLDDESRAKLAAASAPCDLSITLTDGLSALAIHRQALPLLEQLLPRLAKENWRIAPLVIAPFGRVALQDEVGEAQQARVALMLVGERAGLSSPDSMGAYLVHGPKVGNTDAMRNCVSNIRPEGLSHAAASELLAYLLGEARRRGVSGVGLKDERRGLLRSE